MRRCPWRGALAIGVIALAPGSAAQAAEQTYRFTPVDAAICKKRTEKGDSSGGRTKLAPNKAHQYNAGDGNDTLIGGNRDDILNGGRGNDRVFGGGGDDVVCGGVDNDEVYGEDGERPRLRRGGQRLPRRRRGQRQGQRAGRHATASSAS